MQKSKYDTLNSVIESVSCTRDSSMIWMKKMTTLVNLCPLKCPQTLNTKFIHFHNVFLDESSCEESIIHPRTWDKDLCLSS